MDKFFINFKIKLIFKPNCRKRALNFYYELHNYVLKTQTQQ